MFKNLIIYRIDPKSNIELAAIEAALPSHAFQPCNPTQEHSCGWVPPRGEAHGALVESIGGQWVLRFMTEDKLLPASVLARKVQEKAAQIEQTTGRKPGKRESRDLKEEARLDLLPKAFTKQGYIGVWIDPQANFLMLDTSSQTRADEVVSALVGALPGLSLWLLDTQTAPATAMAQWLSSQEPSAGFSIDRECELKSSDEDKAVVKYGRHPLDIEEIRDHIRNGKVPTKLAMSWNDRVSFLLTSGLQIKKLKLLDIGEVEGDSGFDADVAIFTGEVAPLLSALIEALDGEAPHANA